MSIVIHEGTLILIFNDIKFLTSPDSTCVYLIFIFRHISGAVIWESLASQWELFLLYLLFEWFLYKNFRWVRLCHLTFEKNYTQNFNWKSNWRSFRVGWKFEFKFDRLYICMHMDERLRKLVMQNGRKLRRLVWILVA